MAYVSMLPPSHWTTPYDYTVLNLSSNKSNISEEDSNFTSQSSDCFLLQFQEFIPWDNPDNIISFEVETVVRKLKELLVVPILFLIGCPANIINMAVFYKQGLKERINVCLFALSLTDELLLIYNMVLFGEQLYLHFTTKEIYGPVTKFMINNNMIGFYGFIWISQVISAIIASDRCFCILQPLRAQTILSTSTMRVIIIGIHFIILVLFFFVATRYRVVCAYNSLTDSTTMTLVPSDFYIHHQQFIDYLDAFFFGTALPGLVMLVVMITTIVTAVKLRQAAAWRAEVSSGSGLSQRDIALTKMLVCNSIFFLACVLPFGIFRVVFLSFPEMNVGRRHHNFHMTFQWIMIMASYVNSTFNIVVYYTMGSRYRQTLWQLIGWAGRVMTLSSS